MNMVNPITDVSVNLPSASEVIRVLTLQAGYNSALVITGTSFLGCAAGLVGTFAILRKRALMGDALAHCALPGLALAFIILSLNDRNPRNLPLLLAGATTSGVLGILVVQFIVKHTRLGTDTAIGAVLSVFFGFGIVLLSLIQSLGSGEAGGLQHFIYGQTAAMNSADAMLLLVVAGIAVVCSICFLKEFRLVCFDAEYALVQGWPVSGLDLMMMTLVVLVTVVGLQSVGLILVVALLVVPAAAARFWTERLSQMVIIGGLFGALSGYFGAAASSLLPRLPAGAVIVLTAGFIFFVSFLFAPTRGVLAQAINSFRLQVLIAADHLLREIYEHFEIRKSQLEPGASFSLRNIRVSKQWHVAFRTFVILLLRYRRMVTWEKQRKSLVITDRGVQQARQLTRNHRLWEEYIANFAHVTPSHVDYSADLAEHVLSQELVTELEVALERKGLLPKAETTMSSIHPIVG